MRRTGTVLALAFLLAGCSASHAKTAARPKTFTVTGTLTVSDAYTGTTRAADYGSACTAADGYSDIKEGVDVVVSDSAGTTVALGSLTKGMITDPAAYVSASGPCDFVFTVDSVPAGKRFYRVAVGHRGVQTFSEAALRKHVALTLGSVS
jgi:hypothetical protein